MEITKDMIIGDVVAADYNKASVFHKYGIDFCCNGNRSIEDACTKGNIDADKLLEDLKSPIQSSGNVNKGYDTWPLDLLADYIEKTHHRYVEAKLAEIPPYLDKIAKVHGEHHPELFEIKELFDISKGEFSRHMKKEELMVFPQIRKMVKAHEQGVDFQSSFGTIETPIEQMLDDHDHEGERFRRISELTDGYTTPEDGCNTYRVTLGLLKEFEADLHLHIHLENNILFPKAIAMEKSMATAK